MTWEQFEQYISEHLQNGWREEATLRIEHMQKNNQQEVIALFLNEENVGAAPIIYLQDYYEKYKKGMHLEDILQQIRRDYDVACQLSPPDVHSITDFQKVKDHIIFRMIHYERNKELLKNCPYIALCDLALTFRWIVYTGQGELGSVLVDNRLMELWNVTASDLLALAACNTPALCPPYIIDLAELLGEIDGEESHMKEKGMTMLLASNQQKVNGAGVVLYEGFLKDLSEKFDMNFYVLPSSVHEMILVPMAGCVEEEVVNHLKNIVKEANENVLEAQDFLSDSVYIYRREKNALEIASH